MGGCGFLGPFGWFWVWVLGVCGLLGDFRGLLLEIGYISRNSNTIPFSLAAANSAQAVSITFTILLFFWIVFGLRSNWPTLEFWIQLSSQDSITLDYSNSWIFLILRVRISAFYVAFASAGFASVCIHTFYHVVFQWQQR